MDIYSFSEPMYQVEITYLVGGTVKDLKRYLRDRHKRLPAMYSWDKRFVFGKDGDTTNGYQFHVNAPLGDGEIFYVWINDPSLLFHETFHMTGDIMFTRGIIYSYESEEAYAYLGSWIYENVRQLISQKAL